MPREPRSEFTANTHLENTPMRFRYTLNYQPTSRRARIPALLGVLGLFAFLGILFAFAA